MKKTLLIVTTLMLAGSSAVMAENSEGKYSYQHQLKQENSESQMKNKYQHQNRNGNYQGTNSQMNSMGSMEGLGSTFRGGGRR